MILEPKKIKSDTVSTVSPSISHEVMGPDAMILSHCSRVQLCETLWTVACQVSLSMALCRQEYWSELPCSPPEDLPGPGIEPMSLATPVLAGVFITTSAT